MTDHNLKNQLKQLLKHGYSEFDVRNLALAPKHIVDEAIAEFDAAADHEELSAKVQHNQASFAMSLGG